MELLARLFYQDSSDSEYSGLDLILFLIKSLFKFILSIIIFICIYQVNKPKGPANFIDFRQHNNFSSINITNYFNTLKNKDISFKLNDFNYITSLKYQFIKVEYELGFYDSSNKLIHPSDLTLYNSLHILCFYYIQQTNETIISFPNIINDTYYKCIEFVTPEENVKIGIQIYYTKPNGDNENFTSFVFFTEKNLNFQKNILRNNDMFEFYILNRQYMETVDKINDKRYNSTLKLKKSYLQYPCIAIKRDVIFNDNIWVFVNLFGYYFGMCRGKGCLDDKSYQKSKYFFYNHVVDINRNVYPKTEILLFDNILAELSNDDVYPIFEQMAQKKASVHYFTEKQEIYDKYCSNVKDCKTVIHMSKDNNTINGDFLEKYLSFVLTLKQVIANSGTSLNFLTNIFYNIEYITLIVVPNGVCYFKSYLYETSECYGNGNVDKILIPPSKKILNLAKKYGWNDKDIIKLSLPNWDSYKIHTKNANNNKSILVLFTRREIQKYKKISPAYIQNILAFLRNKKLNSETKKNNVTIYVALHHKMKDRYENSIKKVKNIKYIEHNLISECLKAVDLVVTDFSSIIFDAMYRRIPYVIYLPDGIEPDVEKNYTIQNAEIINCMKNGSCPIQNKYLNMNEAVDKINFYINNNFELDKELIELYKDFNLEGSNSIPKFIEYIEKLKNANV